MKNLGVGLIGAGGIGQVHILGYQTLSNFYNLRDSQVRLVGVCTAHESTGELAKEYCSKSWML